MSKVIVVASKSLSSVSSKYKSPLTDPSGALTRPITILKNSELLLLRAQAEIETGDFVGATADINAVRTADGGLAAYTVPFTTKAAAINAVLYEKRYSLLGESAQRLVDLRAYGFLKPGVVVNGVWVNGGVTGGPGAPGDLFQTALPIPKVQLDTRNIQAPATISLDCP